jgi:alpha-L-arabinofuranosidase
MHLPKHFITTLGLASAAISLPLVTNARPPAATPTIHIGTDQVKAKVSPMLYGLMTEEINFSYEGGLYGELIRNRSFKAEAGFAYQAEEPVYWDTVGGAEIALDRQQKLNNALDLSLALNIKSATPQQPAGIRNPGYWGISVKPKSSYKVSFYAKAEGDIGPLTVALAKASGQSIVANQVQGVGKEWKKFELTLRTGAGLSASKDNVFTLTAAQPGKLWLQQVSVFGPSYRNRDNGMRADLMEMMVALKPKFLRFPGGNYVEGDTFNQRFEWKKTVGDLAERPGHRSPWNYWSTDGLGMLEFLLWCEDLKAEPLLDVFAGYALQGERLSSAEDLAPFVQEALDQIEYIIGDVSTKWGAQRAKDGHPAPFPLRYVEIGNEDFFDKSNSYDQRFTLFYKAIKAKYPQLQLISTMAASATPSQRPDLVDEHTYAWGEAQMYEHLNDYDQRPRSEPKIFVGEWATHDGWPMPTMKAAIADAAYLTSLERNADHVLMQAYAPLLANLSHVGGHSRDNSMQWAINLIGYDALKSYGTPSYYVQTMFAQAQGDVVLESSGKAIPQWSVNNKDVPALYWVATRNDKNQHIQVKLVSRSASPQPVRLQLSGLTSVASKGSFTVLSSNDPDAGNSLDTPERIVPKTQVLTGLSRDFVVTLPAYSVAVLDFEAK